ncbi:isocitrate/isopropylmalate family dehydrogenase, partial [Klebsiella pneumoniae]|nr:isocitrate/isopropylmalate family dehydrogenase [Klebsiella pneumoniae]
MKTFTIAVIAGDGVGTEVIPPAKRVLDAVAKKHQIT